MPSFALLWLVVVIHLMGLVAIAANIPFASSQTRTPASTSTLIRSFIQGQISSSSTKSASNNSQTVSSSTSLVVTVSSTSSSRSGQTSTTFPLSSLSSSSTTTTIVSTPASSSPIPSSALDPSQLAELQLFRERRLSFITSSIPGVSSIPKWLITLGEDGKWPDSEIDYTAGCAARTASWPASTHWSRITAMSAAWHSAIHPVEKYVKDPVIHDAISRAMDFWFMNDFNVFACIDSGGLPACPCGTPGFWNKNWFSNIILIPGSVGETCLLLNDTLTSYELSKCMEITGRAYDTIGRDVNGVGEITGSNTLDVATVGIDGGLLIGNISVLTDAFMRIHAEVVVHNGTKVDGIRADGSFGQHNGIIYNGNYGKDYINDVLALEGEAAGTEFQASGDSRSAFETLLDGSQWMIYRNVITNVPHWDFSVLGRIVSLPVADDQATENIKINITQIQDLGSLWKSDIVTEVYNNLAADTSDANSGNIRGNRMFWANDYLAHRGSGYVSTLRMYSSRTQNTECTNNQNLLGFHLADGALRTYLSGNEYEDIGAGMEWNLIPGITVDYNATILDCDDTRQTGKEAFVGGVSDGHVGVAAMKYRNPLTGSFTFSKAWFFLDDDTQVVAVSNFTSLTNAPVLSVLDQKRRSGDVYIDGVRALPSNISANSVQEVVRDGGLRGSDTMWHAGVGYVFRRNKDGTRRAQLGISLGERNGSWSSIGTSTKSFVPVDYFTAWLDHNRADGHSTISSSVTPIEYMVFPGMASDEAFRLKARKRQVHVLNNNVHSVAMHDGDQAKVFMVFWDSSGVVTIPSERRRTASITVTSSAPVAAILLMQERRVYVSDPSQTLGNVSLTFMLSDGDRPAIWGDMKSRSRSISFQLPLGGDIGSTVSLYL